jgi:hypothetical protein
MRISFFLLGAFCFFSGCQSSEKSAEITKNRVHHTIIFIDKTASVDVSNDFVYQKYSSVIQEAVSNHIRKAGDKLEVYFIHENTAKGKSLSLVSRTEAEDTAGMNATDLEANKTNFEFSLKKEQAVFLKQALARLKQENNSRSNEETNISASIAVLNQAAAAPDTDVFVYYLSDMVESTKRGRDFHTKAPSTQEEAANWAEEDSRKVGDVNLTGTEINFVLPFQPTSSSKENNPNVTYYWEQIFEDLGAVTNEI